MIGVKQRYCELVIELLLLRRSTGESLLDEREEEFTEALEQCWQLMTEKEKKEVGEWYNDICF